MSKKKDIKYLKEAVERLDKNVTNLEHNISCRTMVDTNIETVVTECGGTYITKKQIKVSEAIDCLFDYLGVTVLENSQIVPPNTFRIEKVKKTVNGKKSQLG